jgi:parallel beta-helix repeat protein
MEALRIFLAISAALLFLAVPTTAATIHVPDEQPTIQAGIDAASYGDTVVVACGTYYEHDIVMKSGVCLRSETGQADCVTVDAQQMSRVFMCNGVDSSARVEGLTITGGSLDGYNHGGGMYCLNSSPTVVDCVFHNNVVYANGGGMYCEGSSPTLLRCTFWDNSTSGMGDGGGLYCRDNSSPTLTDCHFSANSGTFGGGMFCVFGSSATLLDCRFSGNIAHAGGVGGGMYCGASAPSLTGVLFSGNTADGSGGGMYVHDSSPALTGCTLTGNDAGSSGGAMYCGSGSSPSLAHCTFKVNLANQGTGLYCYNGASPELTHCIIAFGAGGNGVFCDDALSEPSLECCDVYGNWGGNWDGCIADQEGVNGNFSEDPMFCGDLNPDAPYTLHADSPCAPQNNQECGLIGAWGVGCGFSATESVSWGAVKAMFREVAPAEEGGRVR